MTDNAQNLIVCIPAGEAREPLDHAAADRIAGLEALRVVAAVGVVWFHMQAPFGAIAYAGLPILLMMSVALQASRPSTGSLRARARKRARRLLVPWLVWSAIFALAAVARSGLSGNWSSLTFEPAMLLTGPSLHLWYLPFAFFAAMLVEVGTRWAKSNAVAIPVFLTCLAASLVALEAAIAIRGRLGVPADQWLFGAASLPAGLALGLVYARSAMVLRGAFPALLAMVFVMLCAAVHSWYPVTSPTVYPLALVLLVWGFAWPREIPRWLAEGATLSFGVYLVHPLVAEVLLRLPSFGALGSIRLASSVTLCSFVVAWAIRKTPLRSFV